MIFAKGNLAYKMKASLPRVNDVGRINLKQARHPLIAKEKVVPTDISLGETFDTLVITGPNTGGKTVSLKTIGLLTLMAMCGLMLPVADESEISVFDQVLVDLSLIHIYGANLSGRGNPKATGRGQRYPRQPAGLCRWENQIHRCVFRNRHGAAR